MRRDLASVASLGGERKQPSHFLTTVISPPNAAVSGPSVVVLPEAGGGLLAGHANARRASARAAVVARRPTDRGRNSVAQRRRWKGWRRRVCSAGGPGPANACAADPPEASMPIHYRFFPAIVLLTAVAPAAADPLQVCSATPFAQGV